MLASKIKKNKFITSRNISFFFFLLNQKQPSNTHYSLNPDTKYFIDFITTVTPPLLSLKTQEADM